MKTLPKIHLLMAEDARFHAGIIEKILKNLQIENRIEDFYKYQNNTDFDNMEAGDVFMVMVTEKINPQLPVIQNKLRFLKTKNPKLQATAILVDNPSSDTGEFLIFPKDRMALRARKDWELAWNGIETSLKALFPQKASQYPSLGNSKQLKIIVPVLVLVLAGTIFYLTQNGNKDPENAEIELNWDEANWDESQWQ